MNFNILKFLYLGIAVLLPTMAQAGVDSGDTAWISTSTALVLFMTLPGLALFYTGLVQSKNAVSVMIHHFAIACLASVIWVVVGYSLAFSEGNEWVGGLSNAFLSKMLYNDVNGSIPESIFVTFQMTFAIITPALMIGAFVERMKFTAVTIFLSIWIVLVYAPVTHMVWGGGILSSMGIMDFAGGLVVHTTAGVGALITAIVIGSRKHFGKVEKRPHSPILTMIGASMLWVGWFGFNGGSALSAGANAGMAILVTHISAAVASIVWMLIEKSRKGKSSLVGITTGMVAGLATVTPASGFIGVPGGIILGLVGGVICYVVADFLKGKIKVDDSLDVFAVHGVGGIIGTICVSFLATDAFSGVGLAEGVTYQAQLMTQFFGVIVTVVWTVIFTLIALMITKVFTELRVKPETEKEGLDEKAHGEIAYFND
ncbi:MAG: ammonium transporter [Pseudomonadota bacterium]|nr:ammonium transporter [Pseudomonadota bacterium]